MGVEKMAIIRVSGSSRGKINRVYGSSNYISSIKTVKRKRKKKNKKITEQTYYTRMITIAKSYASLNKQKKFINKVQEYGDRITEKTLINILKAYQDTLFRKNGLRKQILIEYISSTLDENLERHKVPHEVAQKVLRYDPHYKEDKIIKKQIVRGPTVNEKVVKNSQKVKIDTAYFNKLIKFSYNQSGEEKITSFIKNINKPNKILSNSLVRNIIKAYELTLTKSTNDKQSKRLINEVSEKNLKRKGVHPDTIKIILQLDPNYQL